MHTHTHSPPTYLSYTGTSRADFQSYDHLDQLIVTVTLVPPRPGTPHKHTHTHTHTHTRRLGCVWAMPPDTHAGLNVYVRPIIACVRICAFLRAHVCRGVCARGCALAGGHNADRGDPPRAGARPRPRYPADSNGTHRDRTPPSRGCVSVCACVCKRVCWQAKRRPCVCGVCMSVRLCVYVCVCALCVYVCLSLARRMH
jgi:hypothetical protein